jgi:ribosomal protein S18 acetylase RimI-like enzyme
MICLRSAKKADLQRLFALDQICFPPGIAYSQSNFRSLLSASRSFHVVAEEDGMLAGFAFADALPLRGVVVGLIITIDVVEGFRRRGVGRLMMNDLESKLREAGAASIELEVAVDNLAAQSFYTQLGYSVIGRIADYYANNLDAFVMKKPLT